jgi:[ribosomal protein S5]-alanine N-acetyltransferase
MITTERLILRPPVPADAVRIAELVGDFEVARWVSTVPHPYAPEDALTWMATHDAGRAADTDNPLAITTAADGLVGMTGLHRKPEYGGLFEIGYWIGKPYWGRGYATEAGRALLAWAEARGETAFVSRHFEGNAASGKVLTKLGFVYTGERGLLRSRAHAGAEMVTLEMRRPG